MIGRRIIALAAAALAAACASQPDSTEAAMIGSTTIRPDIWPQANPPATDPAVEARVEEILARMTLEEKVGQTIQADIGSVTPDDVRAYHLGSVLNGGGSGPNGNLRASAAEWLAMADAFWEASTDTSDGGAGIPAIWGTDAVHGHNKAIGATLFPHNIGLGAANDPDLMREIGRVTAREVRVTGHDWTFAPTLAVPQDDRWGRTYEGFSEDPAIVARLAGPYVEGLQGAPGTDAFLDPLHVIATAKHFLGDGGTTDGRDQGNTEVDEETLRDVHGAGYLPAIDAGVQTVMASYSSWNGEKMHGRGDLLTGVLKERMGFDGFIVGDWNGHGQVAGCTARSCAAAYNAGVDMMMAPDSWQGLYESTLAQVQSGEIPMERLDDAVRRILRVKIRAGVLDAPKPSERNHAGDLRILGADEYRAIAREAVRRSLVLLKNDDGLLPLDPRGRILVAGRSANDMALQNGGWTISWQGGDTTREDFPNGETIWEGIDAAVSAAGGTAELSIEGAYAQKPDAAIVVFGEAPYAEGVGDRSSVAYSPGDETDLDLLKRLQADGVPTVAVFLSGRPLWVNREINASDAFVAAWLPGTEGGGIANMLIASSDGSAAYDFEGRLSFSWPRTAAQAQLNPRDPGYDPQFPLGYGLSYAEPRDTGTLSEEPGVDLSAVDSRTSYVADGAPLRPWGLRAAGAGGGPAGEALTLERTAGAAVFAWSGSGAASAVASGFNPIDLTFHANAVMALEVRLTADRSPAGPVILGVSGPGGAGAVDVTGQLRAAAPGQETRLRVRLDCLAAAGADLSAVTSPFLLTASETLTLSIASARLVEGSPSDACPS
jgi:beta-glucosidase